MDIITHGGIFGTFKFRTFKILDKKVGDFLGRI